MDSIE